MFNLPKVIAHRGVSGYAPENTRAAMLASKEYNVDMVEVDVTLTQDGIPIIFHDETLERTTNGHGKICEHRFDELKKLDAGSWFSSDFQDAHILSLKELLLLLAENNIMLNLELKPHDKRHQQLVETTIEHIGCHWPDSMPPPLLSSFELSILKILRKRNKHALIGLNIDQWNNDWESILAELRAFSIHLDTSLVNQQRLSLLKQTPYKILCFTVDDPKQANQYYEWGIDAVFSNFPDKIDIDI